MSKELDIKLTVAGKAYPFTIAAEKEQRYRRAEKDVNKILAAYESRYKLEKEDTLALTALYFAIGNIEQQMNRDLSTDRDQIEELDRELDDYLNSL